MTASCGKRVRDRRADEALDLAVHLGDDVVAALHLRRRRAEPAVGELAGVARQRAAEVVAVHAFERLPSEDAAVGAVVAPRSGDPAAHEPQDSARMRLVSAFASPSQLHHAPLVERRAQRDADARGLGRVVQRERRRCRCARSRRSASPRAGTRRRSARRTSASSACGCRARRRSRPGSSAAVAADGQPAVGADDLGRRLVAVRHRARRVEARHAAVGELAHRHAVVDVAARAQAFVDGNRAGREHAQRLRRRRAASARGRCRARSCRRRCRRDVGAKRTKKPDGSFWSQVSERTRNGRPIAPARDLALRVLVARVEAAHEADHHLELRMLRRLGLDRQAFVEHQRQRLLAEHVLARAAAPR